MNHSLPKVLVPIHGRPMIEYLLGAIKESKVSDRVAIVVGKGKDQVQAALGNNYRYIHQAEQLGTGHAVKVALDESDVAQADDIIVLYGDHAFLKSGSIAKLAKEHKISGNAITLMTATVEDFNDWRETFVDFGRIIRDPENTDKITGIVERRDATEEQKKIKEVNPGYYCFNREWLQDHIMQLNNANAQGEYYLTDLLQVAMAEGAKVGSISIEPIEALGVNSQGQLKLVEKLAT